MGWWETEHGVLSDEPADMIRDTLVDIANERPDLTLPALREGIEQALRTAAAGTLADPEGLQGARLTISPEPSARAAAPADIGKLRELVEGLARVWRRAMRRAPTVRKSW